MTISDPGAPAGTGASTQALTALIVGILGIVSCCYLLSPVAWYIGSQELKSIREGRSPASGEVLANVGKILGIVGTVLLVLALLWGFLMGGFALLAGMSQRLGG
jgi:Domain of unknown function (DUF4190)